GSVSAAISRQDHFSHARGEERLIVLQRVDCRNQVAGRVGLEQETASPSVQNSSDSLICVRDGQNQDLYLGVITQDLSGGFQTIKGRHPNIEDDNRRPHLFRKFDSLTA